MSAAPSPLRHAVPLLTGALFAGGLALAGMTRPDKVLGFLRIGRGWDASLAFVLGAAVSVALAGFWWAQRRGRPFLDARFHLPERSAIDGRLLLGSVLFGLGWGLSGYCPGPALASAASLEPSLLLFLAAMAAGGLLASRFGASSRLSVAPPAAELEAQGGE